MVNKNLLRYKFPFNKQLSKETWGIPILVYNHCLESDKKINDLVIVSESI